MSRRAAITYLLFSLGWISVGSCALAFDAAAKVLAIVCIVVGLIGVAAVLAIGLAHLPRNSR